MRARGPLALLVALAGLPACHASNAAGAAVMTSLAGGYSAVRRANGECYVDCLPGSRCNHSTGLCDALACSGQCPTGFVCQETETGSACAPRSTLSSGPAFESSRPFGESQSAQPATGAATVSAGEASGQGAAASPQAGASSPAPGADGSVVRAPPAARQSAGPRNTDAPAGALPSPAPRLGTSLPWEAAPAPQMDNPNLPPPH